MSLVVGHDNVDWTFQRSIYGWAALQYQTWIRGLLLNHGPSTVRVSLYAINILELWVNEEHHFGGDFYGFERAPIILNLRPGYNTVNVRLIRDVRANGGQIPPLIEASLRASLLSERVSIAKDSILIPDIVNNVFVSAFGSITFSNYGGEWVVVHNVEVDPSRSSQTITNIRIAPGQSTSLKFRISEWSPSVKPLVGTIQYSIEGSAPSHVNFSIEATHRDRHSPQKFTFLHPSGAVSYAILRPPLETVCEKARTELPLLLALHGAGLEADSYQVRHSFDGIPDLPSWLLFPTGMSPWSGDDWHAWGFADVEAAVQALPQWIAGNNWTGPRVITEKFVVCGHSNGGQGAWYLALHQPDRVTAAAVVSGYTSIDNYVPYVMWNDVDRRYAILESARSSYKHELLLPNLVNTPVLIQHGQDDDNVPSYHGRLMKSLAARNRAKVTYVELPSRGHWWDGAMVTEPLTLFYKEHLAEQESRTELPEVFGCVIGNSHDFGSCMGIVVDQLQTPDMSARLTISTKHSLYATLWHIRTDNVRRFHLDFSTSTFLVPDAISIDHDPGMYEVAGNAGTSFKGSRYGASWVRESEDSWRTLDQRFGSQRGPMDAILRTRGSFQIVHGSSASFDVAVQTSRNLLQYYGAASDIISMFEYEEGLKAEGNMITIGTRNDVPDSQLEGFPIRVRASMIEIRIKGDVDFRAVEMGVGAAWLRPLPGERLELVLWGADGEGLRQAAKMAPTLTGAGQPDFVVFSKEAAWEGVSGTLALGFFDHSWNISDASYLPI